MTTLPSLPPDARVWIFTASRELDPADEARVRELMEKVLGVWRSKAAMVRGCYEIRERRFLVVGADETGERLSGCSIDAMMAWMMRLEAESGLRLVDRMSVFWRAPDGGIRSSSRAEFRQMIGTGEVGPDTPVFDTTICRADALSGGGLEGPLRRARHAEAVSAPGLHRN